MTEDEVLRVLARIARTGRPADRLRAAELLGRQMGMFREKAPGAGESIAALVLAAGRARQARAIEVKAVRVLEGNDETVQ